MLQVNQPDDDVLATGVPDTAQRCFERSFGAIGLDGREQVETDPRDFRPAEVDLLLDDPSEAKRELGWEAQTDLNGLATLTVEYDRDLARREKFAGDDEVSPCANAHAPATGPATTAAVTALPDAPTSFARTERGPARFRTSGRMTVVRGTEKSFERSGDSIG